MEARAVTAIDESVTDSEAKLDAGQMLASAELTTVFLKSLSHPVRLVILCRLAEGKARVGELESLLDIPQAAVSKQLTRLREEGLVRSKRNGRSIIYELADERTLKVIRVLYSEFCHA